MAQLRTRSRRVSIDNGQGHELTTIPTTRKSAEDFCPVANRLTIKVNSDKRGVYMAGKALVSSETSRNIENLKRCKSYLEGSRQRLMEHLLTCETCK